MSGWNLSDIYTIVAAEIPDALAIVQGDRRLLWRDLDRRATALAAFLVDAGLQRQAKVSQYLHNCPEFIESIVGTFRGGFAPYSTNFRYGPGELVYLLTNGDAAAVVFHGCFTTTIGKVLDRLVGVKVWLWVDDGSGPCPAWAIPYEAAVKFTPPADDWRPWPLDGDDVLLVYTGGTTGMPKGVIWRQDDLFMRLNTETGADFPEEPDTGILRAGISRHGRAHLPAAPLMHGAGLLTCFSILARGGFISLLEKRGFDAVDLLDTVDRDAVNSLMWVGDAFARPVLDMLDAHPGRWSLQSLRAIISSGVVFSAEVKEGILRHLPDVVISDVFGSSETMSLGRSITSKTVRNRTASFKAKGHTRVIDEEGRDVVPGSGQRGLLAMGGRQPIGYHKDPAKSAAVFRVIDGRRYAVAGDWATIDADGTIQLVGRGSDCINTGGEKVFPEEVEIVLKSHGSVFDAVVVGVPDLRFGQAIVAVVATKRTGEPVTGQELTDFVKSRLSTYKAPRHVVLVDAISRGPNGKPDMAVVRDMALAGSESNRGAAAASA